MRRLLITFIVLMFFLVSCTQTTDTATEQVEKVQEPKEVIKIGWIGPLTGDAAAYGFPMQKATNMALDEINNAGGIDGRQVKVIFEDGICNGKGAATSANKLIYVDKVKLILGGLCSGETLGAAPIAEENQVILFSSASGSPDITNAGEFIFRNFPSDATSGNKIAETMYASGHTTVGIISENSDYAQAIRRVFMGTYKRIGGEILIDEKYNPGDTDFKTQILKVKEANPDAIYLLPQTSAKLGILVQQVSQMNLELPMYSNEFLAASDILEQYGEYIEGGIFAEPSFDPEAPKAAEILAKYEATYNEKPGGALPVFYYATAYDAVYIFKEAIEAVGHDPVAIKDYLYGIKDRDGAAGKLTIDGNGDPMIEYVLKKIENGEVVVVN